MVPVALPENRNMPNGIVGCVFSGGAFDEGSTREPAQLGAVRQPRARFPHCTQKSTCDASGSSCLAGLGKVIRAAQLAVHPAAGSVCVLVDHGECVLAVTHAGPRVGRIAARTRSTQRRCNRVAIAAN
jgi:hypothetical protein